MNNEKKISNKKKHLTIASVVIFMLLSNIQCYAGEGESYAKNYNQAVIADRFIIIQNSIIVTMAIIIILLSVALALLIRRYARFKRNYDKVIVRDKIRSDYVIIISHELRTPLNIIVNSAKLLKEYLSNNDKMDKQYVIDKSEYIVNNSSRLLKTINNSIDAAMFEAGLVNVNFVNSNIVEAIEDIITASQEYAQSHNINLIFDPQEEEIITAIDRCKIERAILNLISNSIKNINGEGNILVTCEQKDKMIYIKVIDDGIGMSEFTKKHIFEKFYQAAPDILKRGIEGSGLGMYITYNLIKIHGGDMTVESELNKGTTITISMPIRISDLEDNGFGRCDCNPQERAKIEFSDLYK